MLIKLFNQVISSPNTFKCQIQLNKDDSADLFMNQILPYKQLQLLGCHFELATEAKVHRHIKFRHHVANTRL